jgi:hypothetical protein
VRRFILAAILVALPGFASAVTVNHPNIVTYNLEGSSRLSCHTGSPSVYGGPCPDWAYTDNLPWVGLYDGTITIDERKLNAPLAGRTLRVSIPPVPWPGDEWEWEVPPGKHDAFTFNLGVFPAVNSIGGSIFEITTNENYFPLSWSILAIDGPPDHYLSSAGISWMEVGGAVFLGTAGHLSLHSIVPIPLPPAAALLLAGAGALVLVRRRQGQATDGSGTGVGGGARA